MTQGTLHTLNQPPSQTSLLKELQAVVQPQDSLLLIENGVYYALSHPLLETLNCKTLLLQEDLSLRGIGESVLSSSAFEVIDYGQFVQLSCEHEKVISWY